MSTTATAVNPAVSSAAMGSGAGALAPEAFRERFADSTTSSAVRTLLGDMTNRVSGNRPTGSGGGLYTDGRVTYQSLLHLGNNRLSLSDLSWDSYKNAVRENFKPMFKAVKATVNGEEGGLFDGVTPKSYLTDTVWKGNTKDITNFFDSNVTNDAKQIGTGLARGLGLGVLGFDVLRSTKQTYDAYSAQEDGSTGSKIHTLMATGGELVKKAAKDGVAWEGAGAGFALGTALLPFAGPLGGILGGALVGAALKTGLDKIIPDSRPPKPADSGSSDPNGLNVTA